MSFGYQVLGFGMGAAAAEAEVIQSAVGHNTSLGDTKAGDVIIAITGSVVNNLGMGISGFTTKQTLTSGVLWGGGDPYYVKASLQYKILSGSETSIVTSNAGVTAAFTQWRFPKPITSVSLTDFLSETGVGNNPINKSYGAVTETSTRIGCLRVLAQGGYNTNTFPTLTINTSEDITFAGDSQASIKSANDFAGGSSQASAGYWSSPNFYVSIYCNA